MRRARLLYVVTSDISLDVLLHGQLAHMRDLGWQVAAIADDGGRLSQVAEREGVAIQGLSMAREISPVRDLDSLARLLRRLRELRPDVVNYGTPKASLLTSIAAWTLRVPRRVYVIRGLRYEGTTGRRRAVLLQAERIASGLATDVVAVSESVARAYRRDVRPRRPIVVIGRGSSNGVRPRDVPNAAEMADIRARYIGAGQTMVLFVGRHHPDKGFDDLVAALARPELDSSVLVSVGPVEGELPASAQVLAEGQRWHHVPWSDDAQLFMAAADLLVLPTRREGFSNVLVESQLMGTPVVAYDVTGTGDAVRAGATGLLTPQGDVLALATAIRSLVDDPSLRHQMGAAGREWVMAEFSPRRVWSGLDRVYRGEPLEDGSVW